MITTRSSQKSVRFFAREQVCSGEALATHFFAKAPFLFKGSING